MSTFKLENNPSDEKWFKINEVPIQKGSVRVSYTDDGAGLSFLDSGQPLVATTIFSNWLDSGGSPYTSLAALKTDIEAAVFYKASSGGGGGGVTSFNTRTGAVTPQSGDYNSSQVSNSSGVTGATVSDALDNLESSIPPTAPVNSVFGRTGTVTAQNGDYNTDQVTEATNEYYTDAKVSANSDVSANSAHRTNTSNPHNTDVANLGNGTLAELNSKVTDATLDDSANPRPPTGSAGGNLTGTYPNPSIGNNQVGNAKLAQMPGNSYKSNNTDVNGNAVDVVCAEERMLGRLTGGQLMPLTQAQVLDFLDISANQNEYAESESISSTTSTSPQTKATLTFTAVAGDYLVGWTVEVFSSDSGTRIYHRLQQDNSTTLNEAEWNPDTENQEGYGPGGGFKKVTLTAGSHTFDIDYNSSESGKSVSIRRARIRATLIS